MKECPRCTMKDPSNDHLYHCYLYYKSYAFIFFPQDAVDAANSIVNHLNNHGYVLELFKFRGGKPC